MLGIKAVIAESYERIHRSNLVGMGILPLQFMSGESAESLKLTGRERYTIRLPDDITPGQIVDVQVNDGRSFKVKVLFDTDIELEYFKNGGILNFMVRKLLK